MPGASGDAASSSSSTGDPVAAITQRVYVHSPHVQAHLPFPPRPCDMKHGLSKFDVFCAGFRREGAVVQLRSLWKEIGTSKSEQGKALEALLGAVEHALKGQVCNCGGGVLRFMVEP